jgi:hypothetical protein
MKREVRKELGHAIRSWRVISASRPERVSSSNAAAASALSMRRIAPYSSWGSVTGMSFTPIFPSASSAASSKAFQGCWSV